MTRAQAVKRVADRLQGRTPDNFPAYTDADKIVEALDVLGLIKFEEPAPKAHHVPALSYVQIGSNTRALIREETLVETLRAAGYKVQRNADVF